MRKRCNCIHARAFYAGKKVRTHACSHAPLIANATRNLRGLDKINILRNAIKKKNTGRLANGGGLTEVNARRNFRERKNLILKNTVPCNKIFNTHM